MKNKEAKLFAVYQQGQWRLFQLYIDAWKYAEKVFAETGVVCGIEAVC